MINWKDVAVPLITAILGSSFFGIFVTTLFSEWNNPSIQLEIYPLGRIPQNVENGFDSTYTIYDIHAKNVGKKPAINVTLFAFFLENILNYSSPIHGEQIVFDGPITRNVGPNELRVHINKINTGELVVIRLLVNNTLEPKYLNPWEKEMPISSEQISKYKPLSSTSYYISAIYENGSNKIFQLQAIDSGAGGFPYITETGLKLSLSSWILILSLTFSLISFGFAAGYRWKKFKDQNFRELFFLVLGTAIAIHIFTELLPKYLFDELFLYLTNQYNLVLQNPDENNNKIFLFLYSNIYLIIIGYWIILLIIRAYFSSLIIKKILNYYYKSQIITNKNLQIFSIAWSIVGIPFYNILTTFPFIFPLYNLNIFFIISAFPILFIIDILRMFLFVYIVSKKYPNTR